MLRKTKPRGVASEYLKQVLDIHSAPTEGEPYGFTPLSLCQKIKKEPTALYLFSGLILLRKIDQRASPQKREQALFLFDSYAGGRGGT